MFCRLSLCALLLIPAVPTAAAATATDIVDANKSGQADWDRGDPITAMPKLKIAADGGNAEAQALLGYILDEADNDVEAADYYRKAAEQGNADGLYGLAMFHHSGDGDVKKDMPTARALFFKAAEAGHQQALSAVVSSYINGGLGLTDEERASSEALKWIQKGAAAGTIAAMERIVKAHRKGEFGLPVNPEEADRLQAKIYEIQGIDPSKRKRRRH